MDIDHRLIQAETLRAIVEEFVLREGTDYGEREASLETKVSHVLRGLDEGYVKLVFDSETESVDLREVTALERRAKRDSDRTTSPSS